MLRHAKHFWAFEIKQQMIIAATIHMIIVKGLELCEIASYGNSNTPGEYNFAKVISYSDRILLLSKRQVEHERHIHRLISFTAQAQGEGNCGDCRLVGVSHVE